VSADAIRLTAVDNVATVLRAITAGEPVQVQCGESIETVTASEPIPLCHKISLAAVGSGEHIRKYGEVIGVATAAITPGSHVHVHNMASCRGRQSVSRAP
jgi:altronate dehydratase small subunit